MDVAIVTGASSSLGAAISRRLIDQGFRVYGLGGDFSNMPFDNMAFKPVSCNLAEPEQVEKAVREIVAKEKAVCLVVNNAKVYPPEDLRQATTAQLQRSLAVNLLCPLIVVREALAGLQTLQGLIVNIASATPETGRGGAVGAATTGGLRWMGEQLFQEWRDAGVKVTTICPEPNRWRPVDVRPADGQTPQTLIDPAVVAQCVADLALNRSGNIITEIVLRPQRIVEKPVPPVRELPYPKPQPIPYTVPREVIEAEEENDNAELDARDAERAEKKRRRRGRRGRGRRENETNDVEGTDTPRPERDETPVQGGAPEAKEHQDSDRTRSTQPQPRREDRPDQRREDRNNRGRDRRENRERDRDRRDDRNRDRAQSDDRPSAAAPTSPSSESASPPKEAPPPAVTPAAPPPDASTPTKKRRRKPRPGALESAGKVPFPSARRDEGATTPPAPAKPVPSSVPPPTATKAPKPEESTEPATRPAKKAATKKVATKKAAKKATSTKTATNKVATKKTATKKTARKATKKAAVKSTSA